ncbi:MAG: hypothetical protein U9R79_16980 [Armatimonadota bacterium]|nr:hypothetical protein [Armatimonadota bacterium]
MVKFLFLDNWELEVVEGFARRLQRPEKHPDNPLMIADQPWENGNMQLYGSVVRRPDGLFQLWYSVIHEPWTMRLAYAESDDGIEWHRPRLELFEWQGQQTNIVFTDNPHGPAVIYDAEDPREHWRYKMVAGASPHHHAGCIHGFHSPDGIHWEQVGPGPIIATPPDCPMAFYRQQDGRYVVHHRLQGYGRRVFRSDSWDFQRFSEPRMIMEPDAGDGPQVQHYGMGATTCGPYHIGTLWIYHTEPSALTSGKMAGYQEAELTYARSGYAWHRAAQGEAFIPHGEPADWDRGNLQCASQPVFMEHEIRYYYMGTTARHESRWELLPQTAGLGMARLRPDGFVALEASEETAELLTVGFALPSDRLHVNAAVRADGWVRAELLRADGSPVPGCTMEDCAPLEGDRTDHRLRWPGGNVDSVVGEGVRLRVQAREASLFSVYALEPDEEPVYWRFAAARR